MQHSGKFGLVLFTVFIFARFNYGDAIKCYKCNSHGDWSCNTGAEQIPDRFEFDCDSNNDTNNYTKCRKTIQIIMEPSDKRIIRDCGYGNETIIWRLVQGDCYTAFYPNSEIKFCSCRTDYCNSAGVATATLLTLICGLVFLRMC